jgi:thioredoxin 1
MNDRIHTAKCRRRLAFSLVLAAAIALAAPAGAAGASRDAGTARDAGRSSAAPRPDDAKVLSASAFSFGRIVLHSDLPVIVDFWAPWCLPCKELDGPMSEVAARFAGRVRVVRVNLDWSGGVAHHYGVQALPTVLIFRRGELVGRSTGGASAQDLADLLAASAAPAPGPA